MRAVRSAQRAVLSALVILTAATPVWAQTPKFEVGLAAAVDGASTGDRTTASLLDPAGQSSPLFSAEHKTGAGAGAQLSLGRRFGQRWAVEVAGRWTMPEFRSTLGSDAEGADPVTATIGVDRFVVEAAVLRQFARRGNVEPFVRAAAGWLRELTDDRALVEDGVAGHIGGGVKYWLGRVAIRADLRLAIHRGGLTLGDASTRIAPTGSIGLVLSR